MKKGWGIGVHSLTNCKHFAKDSMLEKDHFPPFDNSLNERNVGNWCTEPFEIAGL
jgi:hypothetical protein